MAVTTTNAELQNEYINRRFLEQLKPALQLYKFSTDGDIGQGNGNEVRWLNFPEMDVSTTALSETDATANEISSYSANAVSGTISPYGQFLKVSDHAARTMVTGGLDQISERLTYLGAKTVDTLLRDAAYGTTLYWVEGKTTVSSGTAGATDTLKAQTLNLVNAHLLGLGNQGFASEGGKFVAVLHPNQAAHLKGEASTTSGNVTWSELNKYVVGGQEKAMTGDAGSLFNIALKESPLITSGTVGVSCWKGIVLAKDGLGRAGIGDMEPEIIITSPGKNTVSQPLRTYWTYGVKFRAAHKLLSSDRVLVLYSTK